LHSGSSTIPEKSNVDEFDYVEGSGELVFDYCPLQPNVEGGGELMFDYCPLQPNAEGGGELLFDYSFSIGKDVTAPPYPDFASHANDECQGQSKSASWAATSPPNSAALQNVCTGLEKDGNLYDSIQQTTGSRSQDGWAEPPRRQQQPSGPISYHQDYGLNTGPTFPALSQH
jgi:hypothetical protein